MIYYASGEEMQQGFKTLAEAMDCAKSAPWADGKVFACPDDHEGYAEGGEKVGGWVITTPLDRPTHFSTHFWVPA